MNITIDRVELLHTAKRMATIAPLQSPLDVLRGALLEADAQNSRLILTATNMELSLRESLPCQTWWSARSCWPICWRSWPGIP